MKTSSQVSENSQHVQWRQWFQELRQSCVLTTSRQSLLQRHTCCRTVQTSQWAKLPPHLCLHESENVILSGDVSVFLMYTHKVMCLYTFSFTHVFMWHTPTTSWSTSEWRPSLKTRVPTTCDRPWSKMLHTSVWSVCIFMKQGILLCVITRNITTTLDKDVVLGLYVHPVGLHLSTHRETWRGWTWVKLQCLSPRLRLRIPWTHFGC